MPYCVIVVILCFAVGWLLLIYYFPKVMIYILQGNVFIVWIGRIRLVMSYVFKDINYI